jgi:sortase A
MLVVTGSLVAAGRAADSPAARAALDQPVPAHIARTKAPTPAPTASTAPTTTLPQPIDPPDPYAPEPLVQIGTLAIPAIGLDAPMFEGITLPTIDHGPSHWPGSAMPGHLGNVVIAGHRVTHTRPFRNIDQLKPGDQAIFTTADGTFTYQLVSEEIVDPEDVAIVSQTAAYTATMFACHPPGSAKHRIVAHWQMVNPPA